MFWEVLEASWDVMVGLGIVFWGFGNVLEAPGGGFVTPWGRNGGLGRCLGGILGGFWSVWEDFWEALEASWMQKSRSEPTHQKHRKTYGFSLFFKVSGRSGGTLGIPKFFVLAHTPPAKNGTWGSGMGLGGVLEGSCRGLGEVLGGLGGVLERSWRHLGEVLGGLGGVLGRLGGDLGHLWAQLSQNTVFYQVLGGFRPFYPSPTV